ncbi:aminotransferase class V-fold PLP-dependent enzyme [Candidatus Epulonipiscium viviparus]|uniref:aminotransferase class V-fold PLP-dependent enzyme n=1 Tax=Candidatus Epulonipiscium viviparus TaxID=420336 RepID=UPI0027380C3C|nr:aminotransferase class V-fold PLP-dependent enzyme [Candidatus Epulopiscium viviparus]
MIYFDNASTTLKPNCVADAVSVALKTTTNANRGVNKSSLAASLNIFSTRTAVAKMFNAPDLNRVIFTSGATASLNLAILGTLAYGDHVITTNLEHNSLLRPLYHAQKFGVDVDIIKADANHKISIETIADHIKPNTHMIAITHASNILATIQDITAVGKLCAEHDILFVVDAAQTAGLIPIDMAEMHIDALCLSTHKSLLAPQGLGVLCLSNKMHVEPILFGGTGSNTFDEDMGETYPDHLEAGTQNGHAIAGLAAAIDFINDIGLDTLYTKASSLAKYFEAELKKFPGAKIYTNQDNYSIPIVSFNIEDIDAVELSLKLSTDFDIITRAGGICAPLVHKALGTINSGLIRFSFSYTNTKAEVDAALEIMRTIIL